MAMNTLPTLTRIRYGSSPMPPDISNDALALHHLLEAPSRAINGFVWCGLDSGHACCSPPCCRIVFLAKQGAVVCPKNICPRYPRSAAWFFAGERQVQGSVRSIPSRQRTKPFHVSGVYQPQRTSTVTSVWGLGRGKRRGCRQRFAFQSVFTHGPLLRKV